MFLLIEAVVVDILVGEKIEKSVKVESQAESLRTVVLQDRKLPVAAHLVKVLPNVREETATEVQENLVTPAIGLCLTVVQIPPILMPQMLWTE